MSEPLMPGLANDFHQRTGRCLGGSTHLGCSALQIDHNTGVHAKCLPGECEVMGEPDAAWQYAAETPARLQVERLSAAESPAEPVSASQSAFDRVSPRDARLTPEKRRSSRYWQRALAHLRGEPFFQALSEDDQVDAVDRIWLLAEIQPLSFALAQVSVPLQEAYEQRVEQFPISQWKPDIARCRCSRRLVATFVCVLCRREDDKCKCDDLSEDR